MNTLVYFVTLCMASLSVCCGGRLVANTRQLRSAINTAPNNTAALVGTESVLNCGVTLTSGDFLTWNALDPITSTYNRIYSSITNVIAPGYTDKYAIDSSATDGYYNLIVRNTDNSVATKYECTLAINDTKHDASVVAVEAVKCSESGREVVAGTEMLALCDVVYYSAYYTSGVLTPSLKWSYADNATVIHQVDLDGNTTYVGVLMNVTLGVQNDDQNFKCELSFEGEGAPSYTASCTTFFYVQHGVSAVSIVPIVIEGEPVAVGTIITCTANGRPAPTVVWLDATSNNIVGTDGTLTVDETMASQGLVTFICQATNEVQSEMFTVNSSITFLAAAYDTTPTPTPTFTTPTPGSGIRCPWYPLDLSASNGTIESPNYPDYYTVNVYCQWRITSTAQIIELSFDYFETDSCCDSVIIYDGDSDASRQIAKLAGFYNPPPSGILTTQRLMFIVFTSDRYNTYRGFQAAYTSIEGDACSPDFRPQQLAYGYGSFTSSNYPDQYNNNADCQWQIESSYSDGSISLQFDDFDTEACCDVVTVYDGTSIKDPVIAVLSGTYSDLPRRYNSTQGYMFIRFQTDLNITSRGFSAQYSSTGAPGACSTGDNPLEITGSNGTIQSVNYPAYYYNDATCQWLITSIYVNGFVMLSIDVFRTESCCDTLTIFNGNSVKSPKLAVLSGSYEQGNFTTTQRVMLVRFVTDNTVTDVGFSAEYTSIEPTITACGSVLRLAPNGTATDVGWGPVCYITVNDTALLDVPCRDQIQDLPPNIGNSSSLLLQGGNFGCGASTRNDLLGSDYVCQDNYNQGLTLASAPNANKLIVCIRLPPSKT